MFKCNHTTEEIAEQFLSDVRKMFEMIEEAHNSGAITDEEYRELTIPINHA